MANGQSKDWDWVGPVLVAGLILFGKLWNAPTVPKGLDDATRFLNQQKDRLGLAPGIGQFGKTWPDSTFAPSREFRFGEAAKLLGQ